ncbi:unnamed protein product [Parajaminaea phylloscopi]
MPFISLPESEAHVRVQDEVQLHYLLSTPANPIFANGAASASTSVVRDDKEICRASKHPDPSLPILIVFPSELFSVTLLFPHVLSDPQLATRFNILALDPRGHGLTREVPPRSGSGHKYNLDTKTADCIDFLELFLAKAPAKPAQGWKFHIVACGMSGLVATRVCARYAESVLSLSIVSPIAEVEDQFVIDSIADCEEIINEAWHLAHTGDVHHQAKLPEELVGGFSYRWGGEDENLPMHVARNTFDGLLDRFVRRTDGREIAKTFLFNLYFDRKAQSDAERQKVTADMLVIEGSEHLPYEDPIGATFHGRFPNVRSFRFEQIQKSPFLLSVMRPEQVRDLVKEFIFARTPDLNKLSPSSGDGEPTLLLTHAELHQLREAFINVRTSASPSGNRPRAPSSADTLIHENTSNSASATENSTAAKLARIHESMETGLTLH